MKLFLRNVCIGTYEHKQELENSRRYYGFIPDEHIEGLGKGIMQLDDFSEMGKMLCSRTEQVIFEFNIQNFVDLVMRMQQNDIRHHAFHMGMFK